MSRKPIDGVVQALIEVAVGKVQHLYRGTCPDAIEGFDSRDPQCPACRVLIAAQPQGQAVAECHCATCTCAPGMTPAVRFDLSPAEKEGAIRNHLIALGWTPPGAQQPASPSGAVNVVGMPEFDSLMDHIYEYGTTAEGVVERANTFARAVLARYAPQQPSTVDEAMVERAWVAFCENNGPARQGIRVALTAALATQRQEPKP